MVTMLSSAGAPGTLTSGFSGANLLASAQDQSDDRWAGGIVLSGDPFGRL